MPPQLSAVTKIALAIICFGAISVRDNARQTMLIFRHHRRGRLRSHPINMKHRAIGKPLRIGSSAKALLWKSIKAPIRDTGRSETYLSFGVSFARPVALGLTNRCGLTPAGRGEFFDPTDFGILAGNPHEK
jgi:hypothetical protein